MKHRAPTATPDLHCAETATSRAASFNTRRWGDRAVVWRWTTGWKGAFLFLWVSLAWMELGLFVGYTYEVAAAREA